MKYISALFLIVSLAACQNIERPSEPEDLIPKDKMIDIYTDVYLGNAARSVNIRVIRSKGVKLDSMLYAKYAIDSLQFASSNEFYSSDLQTYNDIFEEVERRLIVMKGKADSLGRIKKKINPGKRPGDTITQPQLIEPARSETLQDSLE